MKKYFYLNGKIQDIAKPAVQINDIGILRGYGVFDFMRTYNGKIFHYDDHFKRFSKSAQLLGLKIPASKDQTEKIIKNLIKKNKCKEASIRLILTGGPTEDGMTCKKPTFAVLIEDIYSFSKPHYEKGTKIITCGYERTLPESKNNNYIMAIKMAALKKKKGAVEVLYVSNGKVFEASTANFFIFKGATLVTPKDGVLKGITRKTILRLARGNFKIEERDVKVGELETATEAFITGTNKLVMPVVNIDGKRVGHGQVGENTKFLMEEYKRYAQKY